MGCPTIFVKVASPKVVFTIEVIDAVVLLDIFLYFNVWSWLRIGFSDRLSQAGLFGSAIVFF